MECLPADTSDVKLSLRGTYVDDDAVMRQSTGS